MAELCLPCSAASTAALARIMMRRPEDHQTIIRLGAFTGRAACWVLGYAHRLNNNVFSSDSAHRHVSCHSASASHAAIRLMPLQQSHTLRSLQPGHSLHRRFACAHNSLAQPRTAQPCSWRTQHTRRAPAGRSPCLQRARRRSSCPRTARSPRSRGRPLWLGACQQMCWVSSVAVATRIVAWRISRLLT